MILLVIENGMTKIKKNSYLKRTKPQQNLLFPPQKKTGHQKTLMTHYI